MKDALSLLPIVAIAAIFWLLIIRPASRQRKEAASLQAALTVGDDVMLTSGVFGTIVGTAEDHLELEIAPGVVIRVVRGAVASVRRDPAPAPQSAEAATDVPTDRPDDEEER
ncbi:preprotein translocase subunit YajC [Nocardioides albidus]|uniref:preprotein translocase subunit YajC n=1 Tax=Nocardioides albidus TaxID=1517589 RepID=UPI001305439E|nr:preprotein translocase subunit YajC [Nocardioides albidus]